MKKYCFLLFAAAAMFHSAAQAQQAPDMRAQAMENTRQLARQVSLDDARSVQVRRFTYERLVQENDLKQMYSADPVMLQNKMAVVEKEYGDKLRGVLSEAQYKRYLTVVTPANTTIAVAAPAPTPTPKPAPRP